jgi:hypothetical protein
MRKTTIYLPEELKARVERTARVQRRSEAEVIRAAIDEFTKDERPPLTLPLFDSGEVAPIDDWDEALRGFGED